MRTELSGHERLQLHEDAKRLFLWAAGLEKHQEAETQIEAAMKEMRVAALFPAGPRTPLEPREVELRAQNALQNFMIITQIRTLNGYRYGSRLTLKAARGDLVRAVAEWWLGEEAARELREEVRRLARHRDAERVARRQRRTAA